MSFISHLRKIEKLAIDNSPSLLTAVGVIGVVGTAILTHNAALKADQLHLDAIKDDYYEGASINKRELALRQTKLVWKCYVPPVACGALTITAIVGANRIGSKRAAAVAAAYTLSERSFSEYRSKVAEKFGEGKQRQVQDEIAQDRVKANPPSESNVVIVGTGDVLCCDLFTMRYFRSSMEEMKKAMNDTNYQIFHDGYASLTDFYDRLGLPRTEISDELGWNTDKLIDLEFSSVFANDMQPCIGYRFRDNPMARYDQIHP